MNKFLEEVEQEAQRARVKFPSNNFLHAALGEEVGEVANAFMEYERGTGSSFTHIREELVQVAALCLRLVEEGDPQFTKYEAQLDENHRAACQPTLPLTPARPCAATAKRIRSAMVVYGD